MCVFSVKEDMSSLTLNTHLQTPVTLCREQSIRGYVSKERKKVTVIGTGTGTLSFLTYITNYLE